MAVGWRDVLVSVGIIVSFFCVGLLMIIIFLFVTTARADARPYHHHHHHWRVAVSPDTRAARRVRGSTTHSSRRLAYADASGNNAVVLGGRPAGCPQLFCACGLAHYLGLHDVRLNLAANWARFFPRTTAQPGAVAVRAHHVMMLEAHVGGDKWQVLDFNGGKHLTWRHVRSVSGYVFVSPKRSAPAEQRAFAAHKAPLKTHLASADYMIDWGAR